MMREPVLPTVRAAMFTAVCLGLGVAAHRAMSDAAVPSWAVAVAGAGVYASARLGARRECRLPGIMALMGVLQVALHLLFAFAQSAAATHSSAMSMSMSMPAMPMPADTSMPGMSMPADTPMLMPGSSMSVVHGGMRMGAGMLVAHAVAAAICAWWLRRGEAALHALVGGAARLDPRQSRRHPEPLKWLVYGG